MPEHMPSKARIRGGCLLAASSISMCTFLCHHPSVGHSASGSSALVTSGSQIPYPDPLQHVFVYPDDTLPAKALDYRWTLSAASRVCKASHGPASRLLWQDLPSFGPIPCMLSSSVRLVTHPGNFKPAFHVDGTPALSGGTYWVCTNSRPSPVSLLANTMASLQTLVGPITDCELTRLKARLRFTRTINLRHSRPVETAVFNSLASDGLYACITPHLHTVYGNCGWYNMHEAPMMLSGSSLRDLVLDSKQLHDLLDRRMPHALTHLCAAAWKARDPWILAQTCMSSHRGNREREITTHAGPLDIHGVHLGLHRPPPGSCTPRAPRGALHPGHDGHHDAPVRQGHPVDANSRF